MQNIGTKIRTLRELKGYSQEYMAEKLGISQSNYSRLENSEAEITLTRLEEVSEILDIDPLVLLAMDEQYNFQNCQWSTGAFVVNNGVLHVNERAMFEERIALLEELLNAYRVGGAKS
jgi:transcriptional regulator with XRE-family HTH domain